MTSQPEDSKDDPEEPEGRLIPVFCTANIPTQILDRLLEMDAEHRNRASYRLWFVTDYSDETLNAVNDQHSKLPTQAFSSPCVNMPIRRINEIFYEKFRGERHFTMRIFFVLDSVTAESETLMVVEARDPAEWSEEDDGIDTLRTDFYAARQIAMASDLNMEDLLEYRDHNKVYKGGELPMDL